MANEPKKPTVAPPDTRDVAEERRGVTEAIGPEDDGPMGPKDGAGIEEERRPKRREGAIRPD